jgi:RimJ/RimL family protein N-acetyltransferase
MELLSPRLRYLSFTTEHLNDYFSLEANPEVMKYYRRKASATIEDSLPFFNKYLNYMARNPLYGGFSVFHLETGEFVGIAVIMHIELNEANNHFEMGYRLDPKFWNQGFATEMAERMLEYGFNERGLTELYGTINPENVASGHILKKIGMIEIGRTEYHGGSSLFKIIKGTTL